MKLQLLAICLISAFCAVYAAEDYCYSNVISTCGTTIGGSQQKNLECNSKYGAFNGIELMTSVQDYALSHISKSFHYLLMSSYFGNFETNRAGFEKLYRELSDDAWEKSIDLMKFITKRGGHMVFSNTKPTSNDNTFEFEKYELGSMAKALELQKNLALGANAIHAKVTEADNHDPEVASYFENNFVHKHSDTIRKLSGHTNDLHQLVSHQDASLSMYLFDEYLQKTV